MNKRHWRNKNDVSKMRENETKEVKNTKGRTRRSAERTVILYTGNGKLAKRSERVQQQPCPVVLSLVKEIQVTNIITTNIRTNNCSYRNNQVILNGDLMEVYFSHTDGTTSQIEAAINSVDYSMQFALLSFTKNELGAAVIAADAKFGVVVKGIIESTNDTG